MKVVFLDIDGVLNGTRHFYAWDQNPSTRPAPITALDGYKNSFVDMIFAELVALLNQIHERTGCVYVLSSSWRYVWPYVTVQQMLEFRGFTGKLIGATPLRVDPPEGLEEERGHQIQVWLDAHPEVERFIILDDSSDMTHLLPRLVHPRTVSGLEQSHVDQAVAMLNETESA